MERENNDPFRAIALAVIYRFVLVLFFLACCCRLGTARSGIHGDQLRNIPLLVTEKKEGILISAACAYRRIPDGGISVRVWPFAQGTHRLQFQLNEL